MIYGKGRVNEAGEQVKMRGHKALLLSYDKEVLEQIGIYEPVSYTHLALWPTS